MNRNKKSEEENRYVVQRQIRISQTMDDYIKSKAFEKHTTDSEIIRQAISNYINRSMSDTEIVHASLAENSRKIRYLENKVELLALVVFEQTKFIMKSLPKTNVNTDYYVSHEFEKFMQNCTEILKQNNTGVLEAMILDSYEQGGTE